VTSAKHYQLIQIDITSRSQLPFSLSELRAFITAVLKSFKLQKAQVSLLFVRDGAMRNWHQRLMKDPTTTDVLSISQWEEVENILEPNPLESLGDVIVCLDEAKRQAKTNGCSYKEEAARYVVHGMLHCLGYDDHKRSDRDEMWALQEKLVEKHKKLL